MGTESVLTERFRRADEESIQEWLKQLALEQAAPKQKYGPPAKFGPPAPTIANEKALTIWNDPAPAAVYDQSKGWVLSSDPTVRLKPNGMLDLLGMAAAAAGARIVEGHREIAHGISRARGGYGNIESASVQETLGGLKDVALGALKTVFFPSAAAGYLAGEAGAALSQWSGELTDEALQARLKHARLYAPGEVPFIEATLARPYQERVDAARAGWALMAEVGTGFVPGYTLAARGISTLASLASRTLPAAEAIRVAAGRAHAITHPAPAPAGAPTPFDAAVDAAAGRAPGQRPFNKQGTPAPAGEPTPFETAVPPTAGRLETPTAAPAAAPAPVVRTPDGDLATLGGPPNRPRTSDRLGNVDVIRTDGRDPRRVSLTDTLRDERGSMRLDGEPRQRRPLSEDAIAAVVKSTQDTGGATFNVARDELHAADKGFAVSIAPERELTLSRELMPQDVRAYAEQNADVFADPRAHLGTRRDPEGRTRLVVSVVVNDRAEALALARQYNQRAVYDYATKSEIAVPVATHGHPYDAPAEPLSQRDVAMAREYDAARTDPQSKPAWDALARETDRLFDEIGQKVQIERVTGQPYATAAEMNADIARGRFKVTTDNSEHPFWTEDQNWKFRVVHDYIGHFERGNDFSLPGEYRAYLYHAEKLGDPQARKALQVEVYGQAAAAQANNAFQQQKAFMPTTAADLPPIVERLAAASGDDMLRLEHYSTREGISTLDPAFFGSGHAGAERRRMGEPGFTPRTYAYVAGAKPEARFGGAPFKYDIEVPAHSIYDFVGDPEGLVAQAAAGGPAGAATRAEAAVRAAGYRGYRVDDAVALFEPTPVTGVTVRVTGSDGRRFNAELTEAQRRLKDNWLEVAKSLISDEGGYIRVRGEFNAAWERNRALLNDLATVGTAYIWLGARTFKAWSEVMTKRFGLVIEPKLEELWAASQKGAKEAFVKDTRPLRELFAKLKEGEYARDWYDDALPVLREYLGSDENAELFLRIYAATSPRTNAGTTNLDLAIAAYRMVISGERSATAPFVAYELSNLMPAHVGNLNRVLRGEKFSDTPKVPEFFEAFFDTQAVVADSWMARAFGWQRRGPDGKWKDFEVTHAHALFMKEIVTHLAKKTGLDPRGAQAALWAAFKVQEEGGTILPWRELFKRRWEGASPAAPAFMRDVDGLAVPKWVTEGVGVGGEDGRVRLGLMAALARASAAAALAGATGDDPESMAGHAIVGAGLGLALGPQAVRRLAGVVASVVEKPAVRNVFDRAWAVAKDETGAVNLRFPSRLGASPTGREPSPNTGRMGVDADAKRLVRGINEKLEAAGKLARSSVVSHDETIQAALRSEYNNLEKVLTLDAAALKPEELPVARTAARGIRDAVLEDTLEVYAQARLTGDAETARLARQKFVLAGRVSQQVTDLETWIARAQEAGKITSHPRKPQPVDLDAFAKELADIDAALVGQVSDQQLVTMVTEMTDRVQLKQLAEQGSKWPRALWSIYYGLNLLSSPVTHAKNVLGNGGALGLALADRAFGEGIELVTLPFAAAGLKQRNIAFGETYELVRGVYEMIADSFRAGKKGAFQHAAEAYRTGESVFAGYGSTSKAADGLAVTRETLSEADTLPAIVRVMATLAEKNLRFMGGTDEFFKTLHFHAEGRALARRAAMTEGRTGKDFSDRVLSLIDHPDSDMLSKMVAFADENTFTKAFEQEGGWKHLWGMGGKAQQFAGSPVMRALFTPFFRTPTRLSEFSLTHTPLLNVLAVQFASDVAAGGATRQLAVAKLATGAGVVGLASWYAGHGLITGDWPHDPGLRGAYERAGWQPYSIYNPYTGKYYSYRGIEPLSTLLAAAATYAQIAPQLPDESITSAALAMVVAVGKSTFDNPYFQSISDVADVIEGFSRGESPDAMLKWVSRRAASLVPGAALGRTIARATDDVKRETQTVDDNVPPELREVSRFLNQLKAEVPGWSKTRPAVKNMLTGEPLPMEGGWLGAILPYQVTTNRNDVVLNEVAALDGAGLPKEVPRVIGGSKPPAGVRMEAPKPGEGVRLSDAERDRLTTLLTSEVKDARGNTLYEALHAMIAGPGALHEQYVDQSDGRDGGKSLMVRQTFHDYLEMAEVLLRRENPQLGAVIAQRQLERALGRLPKSQESQKPALRELIQSITR